MDAEQWTAAEELLLGESGAAEPLCQARNSEVYHPEQSEVEQNHF